MLLHACAGIPIKVNTDCAWPEPFDLRDDMIDYLAAPESPEEAIDLMDKIASHDELYYKYCE